MYVIIMFIHEVVCVLGTQLEYSKRYITCTCIGT